ncbi:MAG: CYTH domain-containing protein [Hymenobacteraceae bacterium]|nr:CYTH domain-containing protein [Hymenobacteraceae bacterium]
MLRNMVRALALIGLMSSGVVGQTPPKSGARLETEYKLAVPTGQASTIWQWLRTRYATQKVQALGKGWTSSFGEETFRDRYFDVPAGTLLRARAGLRHRQRFDTTGQLTKQLVQLKITDDAGGLLRQELKFKPVEGATAATPLAELLRPADRADFDSALASLGVLPNDLQLAFILAQRRRRLYFQQDGEAFSTITLDSSYHADGAPATFTEIEVELNEKRYTGASETERARMRIVLDSIRADLFRQFPKLRQDQRPKYQKLAALLAAQPRATPAAGLSAPGSRVSSWVLAALGALGGLTLGYVFVRRRRRA